MSFVAGEAVVLSVLLSVPWVWVLLVREMLRQMLLLYRCIQVLCVLLKCAIAEGAGAVCVYVDTVGAVAMPISAMAVIIVSARNVAANALRV